MKKGAYEKKVYARQENKIVAANVNQQHKLQLYGVTEKAAIE